MRQEVEDVSSSDLGMVATCFELQSSKAVELSSGHTQSNSWVTCVGYVIVLDLKLSQAVISTLVNQALVYGRQYF
ncbi:MAG: hypothetical protein V7K89_11125 [Nostoc sp.]|uniref:hypothetical protein n=1 Tax=Nostoc sp. TaxID=1180 RepID=UPI002FF601B3